MQRLDGVSTDARLRGSMLALSSLGLVGTVGELVLVEHTESALQLAPFVLAGIGLAACLALARFPSTRTVRFTRFAAALLVAGSFLGVYEHLAGNIALELEVRPGAETRDVLLHAMMGGVPMFAPGILALAGMTAAAATIDHPALRRSG